MAVNPKFQVRETDEQLEKLDEALKILGYSNRADWFRDMKRKTIELSKTVIQETSKTDKY